MKDRSLACTKLIDLGFLAALVALLPLLPCWAQATAPQPDEVPVWAPAQDGPIDPQELEAFLDQFFAEQMEISHIPGAVFVLVNDGEILFAKGYGYADLESGRPIVPDETVFLPGSVGKLFTATAVMQLVEQGKLDLDEDVNEYLDDFQLPATYPEPVTVGELLTHTGGFDERLIGIGVATPEELVPLGKYLAENMPPRVMPAGDNISYCNHCYALAGYLVEKASGVPWAQYTDENILPLLDMTRSTCQQPPPPDLADDLVVGYMYANGAYRPVPQGYMNIAPAGALYATATDMAQFMIAHLQKGRYGDARMLQEDTVEEMHRPGFSNHPQLPGYSYGGFSALSVNGQRVLVKGGDIGGVSSLLVLLPDENLGFFASFNAAFNFFAGEEPREELLSRFLDHYYPVPEEPVSVQLAAELGGVSGSYRWNRYARTTIEKALAPMSLLQFHVTANDDGTFTLTSVMTPGKEPRYAEVEPLLFQNIDGSDHIAFREDESGCITHMFMTFGAEPATLEKVAWFERDGFQLSLIGFIVLAFLTVLVWPVAYLIRRLLRRPAQDPRRARLARRLAALLSILNVVFLAGVAAMVMRALGGALTDPPLWFVVVLVIPLATAILSIVLLIFTVLAWKDGYWSLVGRLHYTVVTLAGLAFVWVANYWNLLGFKF